MAFFHLTPSRIRAQPSPFLLRRVAWMNPTAEKKEMAAPVKKGMKPVAGEAGVPILYCNEPRQIARPRKNHTVLLS